MVIIRAIADWFDARRRRVTYVLAGWVVLIVLGAGGAPAEGRFTVPDLSAVVLIIAGVVALVGLALLLVIRPRARAALGRGSRISLRTLLLIAVVVAVVASNLDPPETAEGETPLDETELLPIAQETGAATPDESDETRDSDVLALIALGVVATAVLLWTRRRSGTAAGAVAIGDQAELESELEPAVAHAAQQLETESDPRMAVLAAYATLEGALAARGDERRAAETPSEHMARVLASVPALTGPATLLGRLYEIARFSDHPITEDDRQRAVTGLSVARQTLGSLAGGPVG